MCFIATSNLFTRLLVHSSTRSHVTMSSSQATCLLVYSSTTHIIKFKVNSSKEKASLSKLFPALPLSLGEGVGG